MKHLQRAIVEAGHCGCGVRCLTGLRPRQDVVSGTAVAAHCPPESGDARMLIGEVERTPVACIVQRGEADGVGVGSEVRLHRWLIAFPPHAHVLGPSQSVREDGRRGVDDHRSLPRRVVRLSTARLSLTLRLPTAARRIAGGVKGTHGDGVCGLVRQAQPADAPLLQPFGRAWHDLLSEEAGWRLTWRGVVVCPAKIKDFEGERLPLRVKARKIARVFAPPMVPPLTAVC